MSWIDWLIVIIPIGFVLWISVHTRKYITGVADYLAAGRICGRYVITVGDLSAGIGSVVLLGMIEARYQTGFALGFWEVTSGAVATVLSLTGFILYRWRETRSLSMGQFLEMRYNKSFRIFAGVVRTTCEMLCNAVGPAIGAKFFIYFFRLPQTVPLFGLQFPTFMIVVTILLILALVVMWYGGRLSLIITDTIQSLIAYPIYIIIVIYTLMHFSWSNQIAPVMMDRVAGESFLNPLDIAKMRDFNIFSVIVVLIGFIVNRGIWIGNDVTNAGRTPHEQKMAGILGSWRSGFAWVLPTVLTISIVAFMSHNDFAAGAKKVRLELAEQVAEEVIPDAGMRTKLHENLAALPPTSHIIGVDPPLSRDENMDTPFLNKAHETLGKDAQGNFMFQQFRTLYSQMMVAVAMRNFLPVGITGMFILLLVMLMLTTDDSRAFNSASSILQDVVLPLRKKPFTPKEHMLWLRLSTLGVCIFFFIASMFFVNVDFLWMFTNILGAIWAGGAGSVMLFGLYSRFGNTVGAYSSVIVGAGISVGTIICQNNWAKSIYPWFEKMGWVDNLDSILRSASAPFNPYIVWQMDAVKFPINSFEVTLIAIILSFSAYVAGSLLTFKKPFNLDRLLHRGKYKVEEGRIEEKNKGPWWKPKNILDGILGITPEFSLGDKIMSWSVFIWVFGYCIGVCFIAVLIWNMFSPWPIQWWGHYFFINQLIIGCIIGVISTVWFMIGGIIDTKRLFKDLKARVANPLDDGTVVGHVSRVDVAVFGDDAKDPEPTDTNPK
jgi:Na+/proline symporter